MPGPHDGATPSSPDGVAPVRPGTFALFSETLLTGVVVAVLCLPVVTALPAIAAGVSHLRRHVEGRADPVLAILTDFVTFVRGVWLYAFATPLLLAMLVLNLDIATATDLPGGSAVRLVSIALAVAVVVIALRAAGGRALHPEGRWVTAVQDAARRSVADPVGSVLLVVAVALCVVLVWMLAVLLLVVPGLLVLAVLSVERRHLLRSRM